MSLGPTESAPAYGQRFTLMLVSNAEAPWCYCTTIERGDENWAFDILVHAEDGKLDVTADFDSDAARPPEPAFRFAVSLARTAARSAIKRNRALPRRIRRWRPAP